MIPKYVQKNFPLDSDIKKNIIQHTLELMETKRVGKATAISKGRQVEWYPDEVKLDPILKPILDIFYKYKLETYYIRKIWVIEVYPEGRIFEHDHKLDSKDDQSMSFCYYLQHPKDSGNLLLDGNEVSLKEGDFVIFDGNIKHGTKVNNSNESRITYTADVQKL